MSNSIFDHEIQEIIKNASLVTSKEVTVNGEVVNISKPFPSPADWRDQCIYFIMIDRFNNPDSPPNNLPYDEKFGEFQGGNFRGIRSKLGYIESLGVKAIWMTPVFKNCIYRKGSYHGYGIQDFLKIDPRFGTEEELRELIDEAHARGIYIIFDIVINHAGDVFEYEGYGPVAPYRDYPYAIRWRDREGQGKPDWKGAKDIPSDVHPDAVVFPDEIRHNEYFRRRGNQFQGGSDELKGDFYSLKEFITDYGKDTPERGYYNPVRDTLIKAYQYAIAKYDIDGFRIDTLKHVERGFVRIFGNAIREYALSIGKKNFLTFGETADDDEKIARYTGRFASDPDDLVGVDAALDFPLFFILAGVMKGFNSPAELVHMYGHRKEVHRGINGHKVLLSSHGEASRFFVTFLDNHDRHHRFYYADPADPDKYKTQVSMSIGCLFALQGIPCLYYGTEQGLHGLGESDQNVREALWGKYNAFDTQNPLFKAVQAISAVHAARPALRYGRQYFREISGNNTEFGISATSPGIIAFSRILHDEEVIVIANASTQNSFSGFVIVDYSLNPTGSSYKILYSNQGAAAQQPGAVAENAKGSIIIHSFGGGTSDGPARVISCDLKPMEIQILGKE